MRSAANVLRANVYFHLMKPRDGFLLRVYLPVSLLHNFTLFRFVLLPRSPANVVMHARQSAVSSIGLSALGTIFASTSTYITKKIGWTNMPSTRQKFSRYWSAFVSFSDYAESKRAEFVSRMSYSGNGADSLPSR